MMRCTLIDNGIRGFPSVCALSDTCQLPLLKYGY